MPVSAALSHACVVRVNKRVVVLDIGIPYAVGPPLMVLLNEISAGNSLGFRLTLACVASVPVRQKSSETIFRKLAA